MNKTTLFVCLGAAAGISLAVAGNLPERNRSTPNAPSSSNEAVLEEALGGAAPEEKTPFPGLVGTTWNVMTIGETDIIASKSDTKLPSLLLSATESRVSGFSGCNTYNGTYKLNAKTLSFSSAMAMTRMACPAMKTETAFMDALTRTASWKITGSTLALSTADGKMLATFGPATP